MPAVVYGRPGYSLEHGTIDHRSAARRGAFFERRVAAAIERWLNRRNDSVWVFHDLTNFKNVTGANLRPMSLGNANIDHLLLTGHGWLILDAKGVGAGTLTTNDQGKGILVDRSGLIRPQPWMDTTESYSGAGIVYRLTGGCPGALGFVFPDETTWDEKALEARFFTELKPQLVNLSAVEAGVLDELTILAPPAPPADPKSIARLRHHVASENLRSDT